MIGRLKQMLGEIEAEKSAATSHALTHNAANTATTTNAAEALTYTTNATTTHRARNLLSDALCTGGEWVSTKRAATGTEILDEYFDPAVQFATNSASMIRAYTTLASFHARLHQNLKVKVSSAEWQQGARVLADRVSEYEECRQLQDQLRREMTRTPGAETANGIDPRRVTPDRETKSVSSETTLDVDLSRFEELEPVLWRLCEKTSKRLKHQELAGRTITLKS